MSKSVLSLNYSFILGMLQLPPIKKQIVNISAQETCPSILCNETFKAEEQSQNHKLAQLSYLNLLHTSPFL